VKRLPRDVRLAGLGVAPFDAAKRRRFLRCLAEDFELAASRERLDGKVSTERSDGEMEDAMRRIDTAANATPEEVDELRQKVLAIPPTVAKIGEIMDEAGRGLLESIRELAVIRSRERRQRVERAILAGANRIEEPYLFGDPADRRKLVYTVPCWRDQPIKRWRVEWRRWCYRRSGAGLLDACGSEQAPPRRRGGMVR